MNVINTAIILTVYNRREVTLMGLHSLYRTIATLGEGYIFDIYMTDDGCTDGTSEAVAKEFPRIKIIKGDGNLYWSGGMRKAWKEAIDSGIKYDYYLWFNDDADLYDDALLIMFNSIKGTEGNAIISGAFCNKEGNVSYGGRNDMLHLITPNGSLQDVFLMNGNLVLIPCEIFKKIGIIHKRYTHSFGDWDYGCRAKRAGFRTLLTSVFVGVTERHDDDMEPFVNKKYSLINRLLYLYSAKCSVFDSFYFARKNLGLFKAIRVITAQHLYAIFPQIYQLNHKDKRNV